jgi:hypothetical protein
MCLTACLSFGRGSIAHAMAPDFADFVVGADCIAHHDGNQAHSAACHDEHKGVAHHHSACHGHKIGIPPAAEELILGEETAVDFSLASPSLVAEAQPDTATRPPNA